VRVQRKTLHTVTRRLQANKTGKPYLMADRIHDAPLRTWYWANRTLPVMQKRFYIQYDQQQRGFATSYRHANLQGFLVFRISQKLGTKLGSQFAVNCGEVGFRDPTDVEHLLAADIAVTEHNPALELTTLKYPPLLLIEIMSPSNLSSSGDMTPDVKEKLICAFKGEHPTRVAWVVYHNTIVGTKTATHGVEVYTKNTKPKLYVGDEILPDGDVGLGFSAKHVLLEDKGSPV